MNQPSLPLISHSTSLQLLRGQPCSCRPVDICQSNVKKGINYDDNNSYTIWLSGSLREGEHLCFLTFLLLQEKFHFWIVHDRVLPVFSHSSYSSPLHIRLLLSSPLGAKIPQYLSQEKAEIMAWPEAHSCLLFPSPLHWLPSSPSHCCITILSCCPLPEGSGGGPDGWNLISFSANLQEILAVARHALPALCDGPAPDNVSGLCLSRAHLREWERNLWLLQLSSALSVFLKSA